MEGKGFNTVIMCVLILGLVVEQIQVEAKFCCPIIAASSCFNICRMTPWACAIRCGCYPGNICPLGYEKFNLFLNSEEAIVSGYCKLGCTSFVCDAINTDVGSDAVEHCKNACSRFCTKGVEIAKVTA